MPVRSTSDDLPKEGYEYNAIALADPDKGGMYFSLPIKEQEQLPELPCCQTWALINDGLYWAVVRAPYCKAECTKQGLIFCDHGHHKTEAINFNKIADHQPIIIVSGSTENAPEYLYLYSEKNSQTFAYRFHQLYPHYYSAIGYIAFRASTVSPSSAEN